MYDTNDIAESLDSTWIVSGQSPVQRDMIRFLPKTKALYVEGAFRVWLREAQVRLTPQMTPAKFQIFFHPLLLRDIHGHMCLHLARGCDKAKSGYDNTNRLRDFDSGMGNKGV